MSGFSILLSALLALVWLDNTRVFGGVNEQSGQGQTVDAALYYWSEVNAGRYFCTLHGGFCFEGDGHKLDCPRCASIGVDKLSFSPLVFSNSVSRTIVQINGFQSRAGLLAKGVAAVAALAATVTVKEFSNISIAISPSPISVALFSLGGALLGVGAVTAFQLSGRDFLTRVEMVRETPRKLKDVGSWIVGRDLPEKLSWAQWNSLVFGWLQTYERQKLISDLLIYGGALIMILGIEIGVLQ